MTVKELVNAANAINKRMDTLVKKYGRYSASVAQYETMIKVNFPNAKFEKGDILHISRSAKKLQATSNVAAKFEKFFQAPTVKSIEKKAREQLEEQGINEPTREEIASQADLMENAEQIIRDNAYKYDMFDDPELTTAKDLVHIKDRRKTWEEIDKIVEILKKDYTEAKIKEPVNEMDILEGVFR